MKDLATYPPAQPMGFPTASRAPQAGPGPRTDGKYPLKPSGDRQSNERNPGELPSLAVQRGISREPHRPQAHGSYPSVLPGPRSMGDIAARYSGRGAMGDIAARYPGRGAMGDIPARYPGRGAMGDIPARYPGRGAMGDIPARYPGRGAMGDIPARYSDRGIDGKYPREPSESRVRWQKSQRTARVEGSLQDLPARPGVGHSAAPTLPPRLGCSLRQAGEARPGFCREVKRRTGTPPPRKATAA